MDLESVGGLVGYRVLRRLGAGGHATVYLGRDLGLSERIGADSTDGPLAADQEMPECVAIRVFDPSADPMAIAREIRALSSMIGGGVPQLHDVATLPDGRVAIVEETVSTASVGAMLSEWRRIEAGEAVTIIAPVVAALAELHALNLVHTRLSLATVSLTRAGRPVLTGLESLMDVTPRMVNQAPPSVGHDRMDLIRADYCRLTALIRAVFEFLENSSALNRRAEPIAAWFEMATTAVPFLPCLDELERRLFSWAPGAPIRLANTPVRQRQPDLATAARDGVVRATGHAVESDDELLRVPDKAGGLLATMARALMSELWAVGRVARPAARQTTQLRARAARWLRLKRNPLIVASALAAAALVLVLTVPPSKGGAATSPKSSVTPIASPQDDALADSPDDELLSADDPIAATAVLLKRRDACIQEASLSCLSDVDQSPSAILDADSYSIRLVQQGGTPAETAGVGDGLLTLVERTGNAAIMSWAAGGAHLENEQTKPASLLVIKGEAGWRLRELFD
ncbi:hypothetical protein [Leifsonia sp. A12D58]|uniref:hypothetical protein n=1 Tax=Leifsonia sp. A12D58 TaxID=3397674 RepID=UPI0039E1F48F